jgi:L-fuculose-phosphate aldolase
MEGNKISGALRPSSEVGMHLFLYKERPDIKAVVHAHPPTATGFSVAGIPLTECVLPEVIITLGSIPIAGYGTPGGSEISEPIRQFVKDYDAYLLENHGATTVGSSLMNAYFKMETMEHFARILLVARQLGGVNVLNDEQVRKLVQIRERMGLRGPSPACDVPPGPGQPTPGAGSVESATPGPPQSDSDLVAEVTRRVMEALRTQS